MHSSLLVICNDQGYIDDYDDEVKSPDSISSFEHYIESYIDCILEKYNVEYDGEEVMDYDKVDPKLKIQYDKVPHLKAKYGSFVNYLEYEIGGRIKEEDGDYFQGLNSYARYDWYEIGGRWRDFFFTSTEKGVNSIKVRDINFKKHNNYIQTAINNRLAHLLFPNAENSKSFYIPDSTDPSNYIGTSIDEYVQTELKRHPLELCKDEISSLLVDGSWHDDVDSETYDDLIRSNVTPETILIMVDYHY